MSTSRRPQATTAPTTTTSAAVLDHMLATRVIASYRSRDLLEDLDATGVEAATHRLCDVLHRRAIGTVEQAVADHREILKAATGVTSLSPAMCLDDRERLHHARNILSALLAVAASTDSGPVTPPVLLEPPPRPGGRLRPLTDDEILLMRLATVAYAHTGGRHHTPAVSYVLAESGAYPSETTVVTPADLDDPRTATTVDLPGVNQRAAGRTIGLPKWATPILAAALDAHLARSPHADKMPIAYDGRAAAGGNTASASVSANLKRLMKHAGLADPTLAPTSITRWRVKTTLQTDGLDAARHLLGAKGYDVICEFVRVLPGAVRPPKTGKTSGFLAKRSEGGVAHR